MIKNTTQRFGLATILIHWLSAAAIFGLFGLGWWMVTLDYYSAWYRTAPYIHKSIGLLLLIMTLLRLLWRWLNPKPVPYGKGIEIQMGKLVHALLYILMLTIMFSGYMISTAKGASVEVFNWFSLPALSKGITNQEEYAGVIHYWSAWTMVILALLHALAACKHHFVDKDQTLKRMLTFK